MTSGAARWPEWETALLPRLDEFGITRLADTTGLDRSGVPTASAVKPATSDVIWVYSGKGRTRAQARVTAIVECLERSGALWSSSVPWIVDTPTALARTHEVWDADRFTYRRREDVGPADPQVWLAATRLTSRGGTVLVPADLCFNGRRPAGLPPSPFVLSTSNGLAAAFTTEDALSHGLCEVIERHVVSCAEVRASHYGYSYLAAVAGRFGLPSSVLGGYVDDTDIAVTVDKDSLPDAAVALVDRYRNAGLDLVVKELPNEFGLPAYGVAAVEQTNLTRYLGCAGYAVRAGAAAALDSALLELAQTRATDLQGAREDRHEPEKRRLSEQPVGHWLATPGSAAGTFEDRRVPGRLPELLRRVESAGWPDVAYVEFPGWQGVSVCRVLVPEAETWHVTGGWSTFGPRLRALMGSV